MRIAAIARSKKAQKIIILDIGKICGFCDYFVIMSGTSLRQVKALAQAIEDDLCKEKLKSLSKVSQQEESGWIVLDYGSVVVHVFHKPMRDFYALERLWSDAKRIRVPRSFRL